MTDKTSENTSDYRRMRREKQARLLRSAITSETGAQADDEDV